MPFEFGIQEPGGSILEEDITPEWFVRQQPELFYLKYCDFRGAVTGTSLALEYLPWTHVGIGLLVWMDCVDGSRPKAPMTRGWISRALSNSTTLKHNCT